MDTVTAGPVEHITERHRARRQKRGRASAGLIAAVGELRSYIRRQPGITLGEVRAALLGSAFEWGPDGRLTLSRTRMALIRELDELMRVYGSNAAADLAFIPPA